MYNKEKANNRKYNAIIERGGRCECCGYVFRTFGSANFHHKDSTTKKHNLANMWNAYSLERINEELSKCVMLCSNCHDDLHGLYGESVTEEQTDEYIRMTQEVMEYKPY